MKLSALLALAGMSKIDLPADFEVAGITGNSRNVRRNFVFAAIKGAHDDGHAFIKEALKKGARLVVCENAANLDTKICLRVGDSRKALANLACAFYGNPSFKMKMIGITGTNGKTTITYIIENILNEAGFVPGVIGTVNYRFKRTVVPSRNTTPGPVELQAMLARMFDNDVSHVLMEVSSHALHQGRTEGVNFQYALFTNLTQDHLDYHVNFDNYFQAKAKLFQGLNKDARSIINADDAYGLKLTKLSTAPVVTYAIDRQADVMAKDIVYDCFGTRFKLISRDKEIACATTLIGKHNVYNCLASAAYAITDGITLSCLQAAFKKLMPVPGRLERINTGRDFNVFVDYAHTEDALKNVITTLRPLCKGKLLVVFGCGGERDITKRPRMGNVVTDLADFAFITSDNPRSEDPLLIIEDIKKGINKDNYCAVCDRRKAIAEALAYAQSKDIVLVAGKGHESYQIINDKIIHFDDREVVGQCLA